MSLIFRRFLIFCFLIKFMNVAFASDIESLLAALKSNDFEKISNAAQSLIKLPKQNNKEIVPATFAALDFLKTQINWKVRDTVDRTHQLEDLIYQMLLHQAPGNQQVIRRLAKIPLLPSEVGSDGTISYPQEYLIQTAFKHPSKFYPLLASKKRRTRVFAAIYLSIAKQFSSEMYRASLTPVIQRMAITGPIILSHGATSDLEGILKYAQTLHYDDKQGDLSQDDRMNQILNAWLKKDLLEMMKGFNIKKWKWRYQVFVLVDLLATVSHQDPVVTDVLRDILQKSKNNPDVLVEEDQILKAIRYSKTGELPKQPTQKNLAAEGVEKVIELFDGKPDEGLGEYLLLDHMALVQKGLINNLLKLDAAERKMFIEDLVYYGGTNMAQFLVEKLLEKGGPDLRHELLSIPLCAHFIGE